MKLDHDDIQGNIVRGYKHMHFAAYLFCSIEGPLEPVRALITELLETREADQQELFSVMTAAPWKNKAKVHEALNVALTFSGLQKLGWGGRFEPFTDFTEGMYSRSEKYLRDTGESARERWQAGLKEEADILFTLYCDTEERRDTRVATLKERLARAGLGEVAEQRAGRIDGSAGGFGPREHFGFHDGFSQPVLANGAARGEGVLERPWVLDWRWRAVEIGEFLLGHTDEDGVIAGADGEPDSPLHNGTFMVWRKLQQEVDAFEDFLADATRADGSTEAAKDALKAKLVGRWPDGTSLARAPFAPPGSPELVPSNDFDYSSDRNGERCPTGAHVRRANPRASLKWGTERARRHRIIRRGLPYDEGGDGVGLVFVCFNASINRQFEQIQGNWLMDGDAFGLGGEQDLLMGDGGENLRLTIQADRDRPARFLQRPPAPLVRTRGGYYLFVPGIAALRRIAGRAEPTPQLPSVVIAWGLARFFVKLVGRLEDRRGIHHKSHP